MIRLIELTAMIFKKLSIDEILEVWDDPHIDMYAFTYESFEYLANRTMIELTNDELFNLYERIKLQISEEKRFLEYNSKYCYNSDGINPFDLLLIIANYFLEERHGTPLCKYEHLLLWRRTSLEVDEDLFIAAFLAYKDIVRSMPDRNFCWKPVISHNNYVLKAVLDKGMSENHFHLNGSAQSFQISWIDLMNNPFNMKLKRELDVIDKSRLSHEHTKYGHRNESLYLRGLRAAVIRLCLFLSIHPRQKKCNNDNYNELHDKFNPAMIRKMFDYNEDEMYFEYEDLENEINLILFDSYEQQIWDYAVSSVSNLDIVNEYYAGERKLMYELIKKIYSQESNAYIIAQLFHVYILLKESVRSEIIQNNDVIGFDNFKQYNRRKSSLIQGKYSEKIFYRTAILDTLINQPNIVSLETRITPRSTSRGMYEYINRIDKAIESCFLESKIIKNEQCERIKNKYFYTLHFIKSREKTSNLKADDLCRHNDLRNKVKKQAFAVMSFREKYTELAQRVYGIDAASSEIGCRPEVFAHAFRALREHETVNFDFDSTPLHRLRLTYHVGEDYIDIIDGLRAVDEAIMYLNLGCGDRLGHALVLGGDPNQWYNLKNWVINISQHDYLDNIAWLYSKIIIYRLDVDHFVMSYLEGEFYKYFRIVYGDHISLSDNNIISSRRKNAYNISNADVNINTYYNAWELRGDDPEDYFDGQYRPRNYTDIWEWNSVNRKYPKDISIRNSAAVTFLYYTYHYNSAVKIEGDKKIKVSIPKSFVKVIRLIQDELQKIIAYKGICIETNPSSNCLIGSFGKYSYEKHPISQYYNIGLKTINSGKSGFSSNMAVCINTDDQSIFKTSLENEYALIVRALESAKNSEGVHIYGRASIYDWIDSIRRMGIDYSFCKPAVEEK